MAVSENLGNFCVGMADGGMRILRAKNYQQVVDTTVPNKNQNDDFAGLSYKFFARGIHSKVATKEKVVRQGQLAKFDQMLKYATLKA
jgi:hypothetical protein